MQYTVDYFIEKFEAIPAEKWCKGDLADGNGAHCLMWFVGMTDEEKRYEEQITPEADALAKILGLESAASLWSINDLGPGHPREKVLWRLRQAKQKQSPQKPTN